MPDEERSEANAARKQKERDPSELDAAGQRAERLTQGSADPPEHLRERDVPREWPKVKDGAREPAPGEADPSKDDARDRRTSSLE